MEDTWLHPFDSLERNTLTYLSMFEGLVSAIAYVFGYFLAFYLDYEKYPKLLKTYMNITLRWEPVAFILLSCSASIIYTLLGYTSFSHSMSVLSLVKQTILSVIYCAIAGVGVVVLLQILILTELDTFVDRLLVGYLVASWYVGASMIVRGLPSLVTMVLSTIQQKRFTGLGTGLDGQQYENYESYIRAMPVEECGRIISRYPNPLKQKLLE